jgi:hypothetical protein
MSTRGCIQILHHRATSGNETKTRGRGIGGSHPGKMETLTSTQPRGQPCPGRTNREERRPVPVRCIHIDECACVLGTSTLYCVILKKSYLFEQEFESKFEM